MSRHEVPQRDAHDTSDAVEVTEAWICQAVLDALVRVPRDLCPEKYFLLSEASGSSGVLNAEAELSKCLLLIVLHPQTLRAS